MWWNKGRLCWKIAEFFYFCHLKKLARPETFGPYYVCINFPYFWNLRVHHCFCKSPKQVSISAGWIHSTRSNRLRSILILSSHLYVYVIKVVFLFRVFHSKFFMLVYVRVHVTWPAHLIHLALMILIVDGEQLKLQNSALCSFLYPFNSLLLRPKCFPQYPVLKNLWEKKLHRRIFIYRVSIKSFPDYKRLLHENCVE